MTKRNTGIFTVGVSLAAAAFLMAAESGGPATYMAGAKITELFAGKGGPIAKGSDFVFSANQRKANGQVEVHDKETDVFHIVDGEATFVTGGKVIALRQTRPLQWTGDGIEGGVTHHLRKGDVITIPAGTPHWYKEVPKRIDYTVLKVLRP